MPHHYLYIYMPVSNSLQLSCPAIVWNLHISGPCMALVLVINLALRLWASCTSTDSTNMSGHLVYSD